MRAITAAIGMSYLSTPRSPWRISSTPATSRFSGSPRMASTRAWSRGNDYWGGPCKDRAREQRSVPLSAVPGGSAIDKLQDPSNGHQAANPNRSGQLEAWPYRVIHSPGSPSSFTSILLLTSSTHHQSPIGPYRAQPDEKRMTTSERLLYGKSRPLCCSAARTRCTSRIRAVGLE